METWELTRFTTAQETLVYEWARGMSVKVEQLDDCLVVYCDEPRVEDELVELCEDHGIECRLL